LTWTNYFRGSEEEYEKVLEKQFREEESEGRMKPVSEKEARKKYPGSSLRIAAQGILDKPDGGHRIIHDGTHGVHLNNEIRIEVVWRTRVPVSWHASWRRRWPLVKGLFLR